MAGPDIVTRYLLLGLRLGRLLDGMVDAYYGPRELFARVENEPAPDPARLLAETRALLADLDAGEGDLDARRRAWIRGQVLGLLVSARRFAGETIDLVEEVEHSYGVRPARVPEEELAEAHHRLGAALPGSGSLAERYIAWRESQVVPVERLRDAISSLAEDFRARTDKMFGLPEGEHVDWDLVSNEPWSGFNYYAGGLRSRVVINTDLPVLSPTLGHLVAHEAYPGHHTEHSRKEAGLVRARGHQEETIFLVGTPQCLIAEGLADLGIEVIVPSGRHELLASHLQPLGIRYDAALASEIEEVSERLGNFVRGNIAFLLHAEGASADDAVAYGERWGLMSRSRAEKAVQFQTDPTWRAYIFCYVDGLRLCRAFVGGDPSRFERLITEPLLPGDLVASAA